MIGTRHGEKLYETLLSREEMASAEDLGDYYPRAAGRRDLNYAKFVEEGERRSRRPKTTTRTTREQLDVEGMKALLLKLDFMQRIARGRIRAAGGLTRCAS